jgi:hypothetical protein
MQAFASFDQTTSLTSPSSSEADQSAECNVPLAQPAKSQLKFASGVSAGPITQSRLTPV